MTLTSPGTGLSQREVMSAMNTEASKLVGYSKGLVGVIEEGVELQEERYVIKVLLLGCTTDSVVGQPFWPTWPQAITRTR